MSSWRFSSFLKVSGQHSLGGPQGRPRALFVALQWGLRPTHRQLCLAEEGAAPGTGQRCSLSPASAKFLFRSVLQTPLWEAVSSAQRNLELFLT